MADPRADTAGDLAALPLPPPPQTEASDAGAPQTPRAPLRETPVAADAESLQPPAPPLPPLKPPQEQRQDDDTGKDGKGMNQRQSPWTRVRLLLSQFRPQRQSQLIDQPKIPPPPPEKDVPDKAAAEKDTGEGSKRRREEAPMSASGCIPSRRAPESGIAGDSVDSRLSPMMKKLQKVVRLVKKTLSWYSRHRSREKPADEAAAPAEKTVETKPSTSPQEEETTKSKEDKVEQPHPRWKFEEARLEKILEEACTRLVAAEFRKLGHKTKEEYCLLTFSVFALGAKVKKQAVTYWWATQFSLPPDGVDGIFSADSIFSGLSRVGFLEPIKNRCGGVIHGCRVNPLVHWMVKKEARDHQSKLPVLCLDLDENGNPAVYQSKPPVLCLTTGNRGLLQKIGELGKRDFLQTLVQLSNAGWLQKLDELGNRGLLQKIGELAAEDRSKPSTGKKASKTLKGDELQKLQKGDELVASQARLKPSPSKKASTEPPESEGGPHKSPQDVEIIERENKEMLEAGILFSKLLYEKGIVLNSANYKESLEAGILFSKLDEKRIVLNISAHVYRLSDVLLTQFADRLEVLQLGGWRNSDDNTYMEVHDLESLTAIGKLKNLRYLGLRGLSRLTKLPPEVRRLRLLTILDVRGCQNLERVSSAAVKTLNQLTHLDLTECYMLEHIGRGVTALSELQVFKGFVFGVGKRRGDQCRLQDLAKLRKLRKLSVNVTTDAYVVKGEMKLLRKLAALQSLTVTWGELPSVLLNKGPKGDNKRLDELLDKWTELELPEGLVKLDVRCYPKPDLQPMKWFQVQGSERLLLKKLYVRGGEVVKLTIPEENSIEILRLRYLNKFDMTWDVLLSMLDKTKTIKCVEVVDMDQKVMRNETKLSKNEMPRSKEGGDGKEIKSIKTRMCIPECTLDEDGVWVRDVKEGNDGFQARGKAPMEDAPKTEAATGTADFPKVSGKAGEGDGRGGDGVWVRDVKKGNDGFQARGKAPMEDAPKTEAATGTADVPKVSGKAGEGDGRGGDAGKARTEIREGNGGIPRDDEAEEAEDVPPNKEDREDTGEVKNVDGRDEPPNKEDRGDTGEVQNADGGDEKGRDMVKEEQGNKKKVTEGNGVQVKDEKMSASSPAPASGRDAKEGADKSSAPELRKAREAPGMVPTPKTEAANGGADVPKAARKSREDDDDVSDTDKTGSEAEDEPAAKEDRGGDAGAVREEDDAGAVREVVGGSDADVAQTGPVVSAEDEGEDVGGGQGAGREVLDQVDQRRTTREDGGGGDTSTAGSTISAAARPPKLEEATVPAATGPAPAAAGEAATEPKEPGKAGDDGGSTVARNHEGDSPALMKN